VRHDRETPALLAAKRSLDMNLKPTVAAVLVALAAQPALADRYKGYSYYTPRPAYTVVRVADSGYRGDVVYARVVE
jgi:hypothetical protein